MKHYEANVTREGRWWMVHIPELDGLTQARRLTEAELMAREYIAVTLDLKVEDVAVDVTVTAVGSITGIEDRLKAIREERARAAELERQASAEAARLARELAAANVPLRDVGTILGVSHQRAHQLVS
jgi:predicted RNase H-like HicB family nuclease